MSKRAQYECERSTMVSAARGCPNPAGVSGDLDPGGEMPGTKTSNFGHARYLSNASVTQKTVDVLANHVFYTQNDAANAVLPGSTQSQATDCVADWEGSNSLPHGGA
jgi:hypothetical protein